MIFGFRKDTITVSTSATRESGVGNRESGIGSRESGGLLLSVASCLLPIPCSLFPTHSHISLIAPKVCT
ncbi:MAG: hypothetical protein F6J94_29320 [Moorea sp. SIO1F2]|uniref:hypothetical protein n=1 Tax=unclassified Moorena TaxID=2683338 RepID=UPI0013B8E717|nr:MULTISPECIES: hypothetical protein [unclassified Moorena]NEN97692.1 hypothetical protein [Moorena sp. SIO3I7]NEO09584.1 hypothetical protein [Moorena sp. SIO3I8]NEO21970.1 hypothetical protein [Moorena sp. SIO4A5]NEQ61264.1 hypothetical protein [Moorena sp. SIO4A1]NET85842.1 hypothetical protein [Moorena sp. SIO1F2]